MESRRDTRSPAVVRVHALTGVGIISFSAILVRLADVSAVTAGFFRAAYALPILFVLSRLMRSKRPPDSHRWLALLAGLALGVGFAAWHTTIGYIGAGLATLLGNIQVILVGLLAWPLFGERPTRRGVVATFVVIAGIVFVSGIGQDDAFGSDPTLGALWGVLTGVIYAIFLLAFRASTSGRPGPGPLLDATVGAAAATFLLGFTDASFSLAPTWPAHAWLIALAVGSQAIGWLLISSAFPRLSALEISLMLVVQPTLSVIWGRMIFTEVLSTTQWVGLGLVLLGIVMAGGRAAHSSPGTGGTGRS